ncbi:MAG TPA: Glu/Leu/Phe/Val dehydrogenase, partial [Thermodesulfovibrionales bacterium]|nr:Glu/Leu/Phe/Val dehydrogenase [Thermodesulfovibrionales bacterium]
VVVDNVALGPSIGGVRVSPKVGLEVVMRLARTMTLKNALAGISHGGGKAGIVADPRSADMEHIFRTFARMIRELHEYIPGPDMGSNENSMAWVNDEIGRAVGLPEEIGGIPLDKLGITGYGVAECAEVACPYAGIALKGSRVAIQGYGSVGRAAARFLAEKGAAIIAVSDTGGTIHNPDGIGITELDTIKTETGSVVKYPKGMQKQPQDIFGLDCDILIPAATPDVINRNNADAIRAKLVLQGANIPATSDAEQQLYGRGILSVPDIIANAGGVIAAAMELEKKSEKEVFEAVSALIRKKTKLVLEKAMHQKVLPRAAAESIARERVLDAMKYREY